MEKVLYEAPSWQRYLCSIYAVVYPSSTKSQSAPNGKPLQWAASGFWFIAGSGKPEFTCKCSGATSDSPAFSRRVSFIPSYPSCKPYLHAYQSSMNFVCMRRTYLSTHMFRETFKKRASAVGCLFPVFLQKKSTKVARYYRNLLLSDFVMKCYEAGINRSFRVALTCVKPVRVRRSSDLAVSSRWIRSTLSHTHTPEEI